MQVYSYVSSLYSGLFGVGSSSGGGSSSSSSGGGGGGSSSSSSGGAINLNLETDNNEVVDLEYEIPKSEDNENDNQESESSTKQERNFISGITGAVVGLGNKLGKVKSILAIVFILGLIGAFVVIRFRGKN